MDQFEKIVIKKMVAVNVNLMSSVPNVTSAHQIRNSRLKAANQVIVQSIFKTSF